jgi:uncharacterized protein (TIGR00369 family)
MDTDLEDLAHEVLASQPFSRLVGARLTEFSEGVAELEIDIDERHLQQFGLVHGGIWCYAADNALTFAAGTVLGPSVVTRGLSIEYLQGAREGTLTARARVVHHDARQAACRVELRSTLADGSSKLCAIALGTAFATRHGSAHTNPQQKQR